MMIVTAHNATIDQLRSSPPPSFLERDPFKLKQFYVEEFERLSGRTLYPAQPEMFTIEILAYAASIFAEAGQTGFLQNRAIWAQGSHLDEIGANVSTYRLPAQPATCLVRFILNGPLASPLEILAGTRISSGEVHFRTLIDATIEVGELTAAVNAEAEIEGPTGNGFQPGQIESIVTPIAASISVENLTASANGVAIENDERFRLRITNAFERISKAGPLEGYKQLVRSVHQSIVDVHVERSQPGYIVITPLTTDGVSTDELDAQILAACDPETAIPMGDFVSIAKATAQDFNVTMTVRVEPGHDTNWTTIVEETITNLFVALSTKLGRQIAPSALISAVKSIDGVIDVDGPGFGFTDLNSTTFAILGAITLTIEETPNV